MSDIQRLRTPQQARSRQALKRIYEAVNALLERKSFDRVTIAQIAQSSDVSIGSIYQRFATKDDLLWELYGHYLDEAMEAVEALTTRNASTSLTACVENVTKMVSALFIEHKGIVRSLLLKYRSSPEEIPAYIPKQTNIIYERIDKYIRASGASRKNAKICRALIMACCREHLLFDAFDGLSPSKGDAEFKAMIKHAAAAISRVER